LNAAAGGLGVSTASTASTPPPEHKRRAQSWRSSSAGSSALRRHQGIRSNKTVAAATGLRVCEEGEAVGWLVPFAHYHGDLHANETSSDSVSITLAATTGAWAQVPHPGRRGRPVSWWRCFRRLGQEARCADFVGARKCSSVKSIIVEKLRELPGSIGAAAAPRQRLHLCRCV
jgi:hypothetical protein